jgi:hypothetical protein
VGQGGWRTGRKLKAFSASVIDPGRVFGKVRLRYEFEGMAGLMGDWPAYAEIDVTLPPKRPFAIIEERHEMDRLCAWEFEPAGDWKTDRSSCVYYQGGFAGSGRKGALNGTLHPGQNDFQPPELLINLFPRWNQHFKDGWFASAVDDRFLVGVLTVLAGRWYWPHDNAIQGLVAAGGDRLTFRFPTRRGMRYWFLLAGDRARVEGAEVQAPGKGGPKRQGGLQDLATRHAYEALDTIVHDTAIREWEGMKSISRAVWINGPRRSMSGSRPPAAPFLNSPAGKSPSTALRATSASSFRMPATRSVKSPIGWPGRG